MKRNHQIIAGLIIAAGISGAAIARGNAGCDGMGPMGAGPMGGPGMQGGPMGRQAAMKFDPAARAERHLGMLKAQLKLTPQQEPLWQAYAEKMQAGAGKGMQAMRNQPTDEKLTAPERMAKMQSLMQERLAAMSGVHDSFSRLYDALTPEQKAIADQQAAQMGKQGGRSGGRPGPRRGAPPQG